MLDWMGEIGLVYALLAAVCTWCGLRVLHPLAPRLNLLDFPLGRKDHAHPTPIVGGLAMVTGFLVVMPFIPEHAMSTMVSVAAASLLLVAVGLHHLRPGLRRCVALLSPRVAPP